jgi:hypothetical protein
MEAGASGCAETRTILHAVSTDTRENEGKVTTHLFGTGCTMTENDWSGSRRGFNVGVRDGSNKYLGKQYW